MTRERFAEILREYEYTEVQICMLWKARPSHVSAETLDERRVRETAKHLQPIKDLLIQR